MIAVSLRLLAGQYHATPWGRHVNEGEVEWPPSPWRLLRLLLATWHTKAAHRVDETVMRRLVDRLAASLPEYRLPPITLAHTRHYMPLYNSCRDEKTAKVFDTFACLDRNAVLGIAWPDVDLDKAERHALETLLPLVSYLGRAESWVEMAVVEDLPPGHVCRAMVTEEEGDAGETIRLLAPLLPTAYTGWRAAMTAGGNGRGKKPLLPEGIWEALHANTADLRSAGWSDPPGSRWVIYCRPRSACNVRPAPVRQASRQAGLPTVARFAVASTVAPTFVQGVSFAEKLHRALVRLSSRVNGTPLPVFTGRSEDGALLDGHGHLHVLWEANDTRRRTISHVTLHAPMGFTPEARAVLDELRLLYGRKGHDIQLVGIGIGQPEDFAGARLSAGQCPLFVSSRTWRSRTPFVPTRHPKTHRDGRPKLDAHGLQIGSPLHDLLRLLELQGLPRPTVTASCGTPLGGQDAPWLDFRTTRYDGEGSKGGTMGYGFRLEFPEPVTGPLVLGYGAHFGLGCFWPEEAGLIAASACDAVRS